MLQNIRNISLYWISIISIFIAAWNLQSHIFINWDVSWLMHLSNTLFEEGIDSNIFVEINPPMILYLYLPPIILTHFFPLSNITSLNLYVCFLVFLSISINRALLKQIFSQNHPALTYFFLLLISFVLLVLPVNQFGQREHLTIILILPYLFLTTLRLQNQKINQKLAFFIGFLAGLGFTIKPFFVLPFFLIELYMIIHKKSFFAWFRVESLTIVLIILMYVISIFIFQPNYLKIIIPLAKKYYYIGQTNPWIYLLNDILIFCLYIIFFFLISIKKNSYLHLSLVLWLALIGFTLAFFSQQSFAYYREFPAFVMAILLGILILISYIPKSNLFSNLFAYIAVVLLFASLLFVNTIAIASIQFKKNGYFNEIISFMNSYILTGSCYFISTSPPFPEVDYALNKKIEINSKSTFPLWFISGYVKRKTTTTNPDILKDLQHDKTLFLHSLANIIATNKPDFIFVDKRVVINSSYYYFDYLKEFSGDSTFQKAWQPYQYFKSVYYFDVYRRNKDFFSLSSRGGQIPLS